MIYTIGRTSAYEQYFREQEQPQKAVGGSVWNSFHRAAASLRHGSDYSVYGVMADWEKDTKPNEEGGDFNDLLIDADLVKIDVLTPQQWSDRFTDLVSRGIKAAEDADVYHHETRLLGIAFELEDLIEQRSELLRNDERFGKIIVRAVKELIFQRCSSPDSINKTKTAQIKYPWHYRLSPEFWKEKPHRNIYLVHSSEVIGGSRWYTLLPKFTSRADADIICIQANRLRFF